MAILLIYVAFFSSNPAKNESQKLLLSFNFMEVVLAKNVSPYVPSFSRMTLLILLEPLKLMIFEFIELGIFIKDLSRYVFESSTRNKHLKLLVQVRKSK